VSDVRRGVVIPLDVAAIVVKVFLPSNERKMRKAAPEVVAAVTEFKRCVTARLLDEGLSDKIDKILSRGGGR
jgi:hypothetical protein